MTDWEITSWVCKHGSIDQIKNQLDIILTNCSIGDQYIYKAVVVENLVDFRRLREAYEVCKVYSISAGFGSDVLIQSACEVGDIELVRALLKDPNVDPTNHNNACLSLAHSNGHYSIVQLLLHDGRTNPMGFFTNDFGEHNPTASSKM